MAKSRSQKRKENEIAQATEDSISVKGSEDENVKLSYDNQEEDEDEVVDNEPPAKFKILDRVYAADRTGQIYPAVISKF